MAEQKPTWVCVHTRLCMSTVSAVALCVYAHVFIVSCQFLHHKFGLAATRHTGTCLALAHHTTVCRSRYLSLRRPCFGWRVVPTHTVSVVTHACPQPLRVHLFDVETFVLDPSIPTGTVTSSVMLRVHFWAAKKAAAEKTAEKTAAA